MSYLSSLYNYLTQAYIYDFLFAIIISLVFYKLRAGTFMSMLVFSLIIGISVLYQIYPIWIAFITLFVFIVFNIERLR